MEPEHERPVVREFGPPLGMARRRVYGAVTIALVLGFFAIPLTLYGNSGLSTPYGQVFDKASSEGPSVSLFALKASGMIALALIIPWLATRRYDSGSRPSPEDGA